MSDKVKYSHLCAAIAKGDIRSVYFFHGGESYLIEDLINKIKTVVVDENIKDFNFDHFYGDEADPAQIINTASSFPMMTDKRLVLIEDVQRLSQKGKDMIASYVQSPSDFCVLICTSGKADMRQKFYSTLNKNSVVYEARPLYENHAEAWLQRFFSERKISVTPGFIASLIEKNGTDLWSLHNEAEKIITYSWGKERLDKEDALVLGGDSRTFTIWNLTDSVGRKDRGQAQRILANLLENGQSAAGLIIQLQKRMFLLLRIQLYRRANPGGNIATAFHLTGFFARIYLEQAEHFKIPELRRIIRVLLEADLMLKSGFLQPQLLLTVLIHELTAGLRPKNELGVFLV